MARTGKPNKYFRGRVAYNHGIERGQWDALYGVPITSVDVIKQLARERYGIDNNDTVSLEKNMFCRGYAVGRESVLDQRSGE